MRVAILQHAAHEGPGVIGDLLRSRGHEPTAFRADLGALPADDAHGGLVILGGPQAVYARDRHPWLGPELQRIRADLARGIPILGICLGSQLLAAALGNDVRRHHQPEIGWYPVRRADTASASPFADLLPEGLMVLHWHGDTYDLPAAAVRLFSSDACIEQGFSVGDRVLALQFHPELTPDMVETWVRIELPAPGPGVQTADGIRSGAAHCAAGHAFIAPLLVRLFG